MKKSIHIIATVFVATTALSALPAYAESSDLLKKALIDDATPYIHLNYRFEHVDQAGFSRHANASTLRTALGYKTGALYDFSASIEFENVSYLGVESFNNTLNGKTNRPVVADPDSTEVNHAFLSYAGLPDTVIDVGRQPIILDNHRFVGTVPWRQNHQSFDAVTINNRSLPDTTIFYSYVDNVNRIFSNDSPVGDLNGNTHLINASYDGWEYGKLIGYGYLLDFDAAFAQGLSSKTFGARFTGSTPFIDNATLLYTAEYARQSDYGDNPTSYDADYYMLEGGIGYKGLTTKLGYEVLGSDNGGTVAFQTPLATLHKFNGWADQFLTTPAAGLEDIYAHVSYKVSGVNEILDDTQLTVVYHDFSADIGGADYGSEWNASIGRHFMEHYSLLLKFADYEADGFATDKQVAWLELGAKF